MTLEAQKARREQRQQRQQQQTVDQQQPPLSASLSSTRRPGADSVTVRTRKPIVTLPPTVAPTSTAPAVPALVAETTSHPSATLPQSSTTAATQRANEDDDGLSSSLDQLALTKPAPPLPLTPLQALAARPRGTPASSNSRPATDTAAARRLVMGALGMRNERSEEEKDKERQARRGHQRMKREQLAVQRKQADDGQPQSEHATAAETADAT